MPIAESTTLIVARGTWSGRAQAQPEIALAIIWSRTEPERLGELLFVDGPSGGPFGFGRAADPSTHALELVRQRPGEATPTGPTRAPGISRHQWSVQRRGRTLELENVGRRALRVNGVAVDRATVSPGDLVEIGDELLFYAILRPPRMPLAALPHELIPAFAGPDMFGLVGESAAAWELRRQLALVSGRTDHVLLTGPSGSGKEHAARAIHALSRRAGERMIARNAATFPDALVDAELFGNARDYPNPGMPERTGLIGAADGTTLFLDEIGELPHALQAHLLRVLDGGDYQRLGEVRARRADARVIAATNRPPDELKHDLLARLCLRVALPGLGERREDIPLLARHLLRRIAATDPLVAERCFDGGDPSGEPRWTARFVGALVQARYHTHVRELEAWLWRAMLDSPEGTLDEPPRACIEANRETDDGDDDEADEPGGEVGTDPRTLESGQVRAALAQHGGSRERAWRALGLRSRHQLLRLIRRYGLQ
jgi:two-component system nitrogen regulation response regulator GlnG/two-component system response regulator HydG